MKLVLYFPKIMNPLFFAVRELQTFFAVYYMVAHTVTQLIYLGLHRLFHILPRFKF